MLPMQTCHGPWWCRNAKCNVEIEASYSHDSYQGYDDVGYDNADDIIPNIQISFQIGLLIRTFNGIFNGISSNKFNDSIKCYLSWAYANQLCARWAMLIGCESPGCESPWQTMASLWLLCGGSLWRDCINYGTLWPTMGAYGGCRSFSVYSGEL